MHLWGLLVMLNNKIFSLLRKLIYKSCWKSMQCSVNIFHMHWVSCLSSSSYLWDYWVWLFRYVELSVGSSSHTFFDYYPNFCKCIVFKIMDSVMFQKFYLLCSCWRSLSCHYAFIKWNLNIGTKWKITSNCSDAWEESSKHYELYRQEVILWCFSTLAKNWSDGIVLYSLWCISW